MRQVLASRQKHAALLKHKLGITPFSELSEGFKTVKETQAYQKTSEVVGQAGIDFINVILFNQDNV